MEWVGVGLAALGAAFFFAGTLALLRFPGPLDRLHGLTKADNVGLGFVAVGLSLHAGSLAVAAKLLLIWLVALSGSALACHLIGDAALASEERGAHEHGRR